VRKRSEHLFLAFVADSEALLSKDQLLATKVLLAMSREECAHFCSSGFQEVELEPHHRPRHSRWTWVQQNPPLCGISHLDYDRVLHMSNQHTERVLTLAIHFSDSLATHPRTNSAVFADDKDAPCKQVSGVEKKHFCSNLLQCSKGKQ